jgi:hypothetical protein
MLSSECLENAPGKIVMRTSILDEMKKFASPVQDYKGSGDGQKW